MKSIIASILFICILSIASAQDFKTDMANAKSNYTGGKLEEAHFALLQAMQEIDIKIGQEVIKLLPQKMDTMTANVKDDNVAASVGFVGTTIHRTYGKTKSGDLSIISNSPMIGTLNTLINSPMMSGMMSDGNSKIIKVQGYKGRIEKQANSDGTTNYSLDIPMGSSLVTYKLANCTDAQILSQANTIPLPQIAKLIQ